MQYHNPMDPAGTGAMTNSFEGQLARLARRLLGSAIGISPADRQFLQDLARDEGRYPMKTMRRLNRIAATSVRVEDREGPAEIVRADILAQIDRIGCVFSAFDAENLANDHFDRAQWKLERALRTGSLTSAVIEETEAAAVQQLVTTRESIDVVRSLARNEDRRSRGPWQGDLTNRRHALRS